MVIIDFILAFVFIMIVSVMLFLIVEKLFDKSPTNFQEKIRLLFKKPKNLDDETRKLSCRYTQYFIGCVFLAISIQDFIHLYFGRFPIVLLLLGIIEIFNEHFYKVSEIDCRYREKYGWKYVLKVSYHKELMKNSPITLILNGIFILALLIFLILFIVLVPLVFMLNKFYP